jgi:hypothetical protein
MGQYYKPICLDTREYLYTHDYGSGLKLMEHSWIGNRFMNVVTQLLFEGGAWHKKRIVWAGDYADTGLFIDEDEPEVSGLEREEGEDCSPVEAKTLTLYTLAGIMFTQIQPGLADGPNIQFIINHTKQEYVDLSAVVMNNDEEDWGIHPLSILTCDGNGRGGGDYRGGSEDYIGSWAGDVISSDLFAPHGYTEIKPDFNEKD